MDFIEALITVVCYGFIIAILVRLWKVLGLLKSVLNAFLEHHETLWEALDAIREQWNRENRSECE